MKGTFTVIGLTLNLIGAIILALSIKIKDPVKESGTGILINNKSAYTHTSINKTIFITGISLLAIGFIFQIIGLI